MAFKYTDAVFAMPKVAVFDPENGLVCLFVTNGVDKAVLMALANRADKDTGKCWAGYGKIAEDTWLSRSAVIDSTKRLEFAGLITIEADNRRRSNTYTVNLPLIIQHTEGQGAKPVRFGKRNAKGLDLSKFRRKPKFSFEEEAKTFDIADADDDLSEGFINEEDEHD